MSIVSFESRDEKDISHAIANFLTAYGILRLLRKCGGAKLKGVPVNELFTYTLTNAFRMGSFYMQNKLGQVREGFSKNTYYRFLMNPRTNWLRFTTMLSARIINAHIRPLTSENRDDCFAIDDSLYERTGVKRTELASWVFDHVSMRCKKGFRLLTLGWTDGCTFTRYMLLAVSKRDNEDERTLGELFYLMIAEVADITYHESMQIIVEAMLATIQEEFHITDEQVNAFYEKFMTKLPESMQHLLRAS